MLMGYPYSPSYCLVIATIPWESSKESYVLLVKGKEPIGLSAEVAVQVTWDIRVNPIRSLSHLAKKATYRKTNSSIYHAKDMGFKIVALMGYCILFSQNPCSSCNTTLSYLLSILLLIINYFAFHWSFLPFCHVAACQTSMFDSNDYKD